MASKCSKSLATKACICLGQCHNHRLNLWCKISVRIYLSRIVEIFRTSRGQLSLRINRCKNAHRKKTNRIQRNLMKSTIMMILKRQSKSIPLWIQRDQLDSVLLVIKSRSFFNLARVAIIGWRRSFKIQMMKSKMKTKRQRIRLRCSSRNLNNLIWEPRIRRMSLLPSKRVEEGWASILNINETCRRVP